MKTKRTNRDIASDLIAELTHCECLANDYFKHWVASDYTDKTLQDKSREYITRQTNAEEQLLDLIREDD